MANELDFSGKTVFVIGGSSGIGNGIAHGFCQRGAEVHVAGTRADAAGYNGIPGSDLNGLTYSQLDVFDPEAIESFMPKFDQLDVLVLSQGHVVYKRGEFQQPGWDKVMAINLDSLMHCARRFHHMLKSAQGSLIIVSSVSGFVANRGNPAYAASKAGAVSLTATLGVAWAAEGIRVNGIAPGFVKTKLTDVTFQDPRRRAATLASIPLQRAGTPAEMSNAVLFLASPLSSYIIGQTLIVDGGGILS